MPMILKVDLTNEKRLKILNRHYDAFTDEANKAVGAALVNALENGIVIEDADRFDCVDDAAAKICNAVNMDREGAADTEPRMIVAGIIKKFL